MQRLFRWNGAPEADGLDRRCCGLNGRVAGLLAHPRNVDDLRRGLDRLAKIVYPQLVLTACKLQREMMFRIVCNQGRHRSVSMSLALASYLHCMGLPVYIYFRGFDQERYPAVRRECGCPTDCAHGVGDTTAELNGFVRHVVDLFHLAMVNEANTGLPARS